MLIVINTHAIGSLFVAVSIDANLSLAVWLQSIIEAFSIGFLRHALNIAA